MTKLITAEDAKILNELRESLNKIYNVINESIREAALNGKTEIKYSIFPYLYRNHKVIVDILRDSLTEVGYYVTITNPSCLKQANSTNEVTLNISWSGTTNGGNNSELETEK